ncbi:hypothetical protein LZ554_001136 [Drepanopeziza brunnea f. sp. 'monogermtubi']|nr:hypothetical protein LZ554_001136 [Drepanopeziza brunnea f. sp. 'monogermtubi']
MAVAAAAAEEEEVKVKVPAAVSVAGLAAGSGLEEIWSGEVEELKELLGLVREVGGLSRGSQAKRGTLIRA